MQRIRVDVEADRRSQHRIYNQHDCLTPHNQRPYPYYAGNIVASPFVLTPSRPRVSPFPGAQAEALFSVPFTLISLERSAPLVSSLASHSSRIISSGTYSLRCHCARGLITPIMTRNETRRGKEGNGHGYIIRDRNNARFSFFFT